MNTYCSNFPLLARSCHFGRNGAYVLTAADSNKKYVGSTKNLYTRIKAHRNMLCQNNHYSSELQEAFNNGEKIEIHVYLTETRKDAYEIEQQKINDFSILGILINTRTNVNVGMPIRKYRRMKRDEEEGYKSPGQRQRETKAAKSRRVSINGIIYPNVTHAALELSVSYSLVNNRVLAKSDRFKDWFFLD